MRIDEAYAFRWRTTFESGKLSGLYEYGIEDDISFTKTLQVNYLEGLKNGPVSAFYMNGEKQYEGHYIEDEKNGLFEFFYPDGKIAMKCSFENGYPEGHMQAWDMTGKAIADGTFRGGRPWNGSLILKIDDFISNYAKASDLVEIAQFKDGELMASDFVFIGGSEFRDVRKNGS